MAGSIPLWKQRQVWVAVVALAAIAFWVVGLGAGWRGWILTPTDTGIVAHAQGFGQEAFIWWMPATVISLTAVVMAVGVSIVRHLIDGVAGVDEGSPLESFEPLEPFEPADSAGNAEPGTTSGDELG